MCYNLCVMRTTLQTALAFCLISTVACAAVATLVFEGDTK